MIQENMMIDSVVLEVEGQQTRPVSRQLSLVDLCRLSDIGSSRVCAPCMAFENLGQLPQEEEPARLAIEEVKTRLLGCREYLDRPADTTALHNMEGMLRYIERALHSAQVYFAERRFGAARNLAETLRSDFDVTIAGKPGSYPALRSA